jgi:hypothetical protein
MNKIQSLEDTLDEQAKGKIFKAWEDVFQASNKVLQHSKAFGFSGISVIPDPNIHQMLRTLRYIGPMLTDIMESLKELELSPDDIRLMINAIEQIRRLEMVAMALIGNDEALFNEAIKDLDGQAVI